MAIKNSIFVTAKDKSLSAEFQFNLLTIFFWDDFLNIFCKFSLSFVMATNQIEFI